MKIDLFSGFRRLAIALAVLWVVGWTIAGFTQSPHTHPYILVPGPDRSPIVIDSSKCMASDATEPFSFASEGTTTEGTLCFMSSTLASGERLIPYGKGDAPGTFLWDERHSQNVQFYTFLYAQTALLHKSAIGQGIPNPK